MVATTTTTNGTNGKVDSKKKETTAADKEMSFYEDINNLKKLCDFLRSKNGPACREALLMDKRVLYVKGEKLVNFLAEPKKGTKWPKNLPRFKSRQEAVDVCKDLCREHFLLRSEKRGKGELAPSRVRDFDEAGYLTWVYEGDKTMSHLMTTALIIGFLFCVCFPIWPHFLRVFVWYMSVTFSLFMFGFVTFRGLLFMFVWILGFEFWIFPNLFDETLNFVDSFKPIYSFEPTKKGQLPYRLGVGVAFFGFCYWAVTQPSEFDGYLAAQGDFLKDLYAGTLLSDVSQQDKENIDKPKMQSLDDLLKGLEEDEEDELDVLGEDLDDEDKLDSLFENLLDKKEVIDKDED